MTRIIGLGSPFGDDRVGWRVIELLRGRLPDAVELLALDRPGAALINWMQNVDHLVLIDAVLSEAGSGNLIRLDPVDLEVGTVGLSSHALALHDTIELAERLGCLPGQVEIYGIGIAHWTNAGLSPQAETAAAELTSLITAKFA